MQRVTNCILTNNETNEVLTLQKPRRGWWVAPGGKMELGETIRESVKREYWEETGYFIKDPNLRGIFTIIIEEDGKIINEWMMFTFHTSEYQGDLLEESPEGKLAWQPILKVMELPMAPGDYYIFDHVLNGDGMMYGNFTYTKDFKLLSYRLDVNGKITLENRTKK
ncbi:MULTISPECIES: 8-oxo-dGTP diphosphatase [Bacillaceae]|uniref:8-oxo-dGTP diphosphatase n=1 Tax=Evansella alkalicola TaxID=745819 RepID=A0ABS6JYE7_9BACI|nr:MULTISPECIES: 8-oxo-dGTP diphosphatase [Bacillaceae]MBU9722232.1 8-oxo-dGTP diphosphatase [Bacillus alkalicola]